MSTKEELIAYARNVAAAKQNINPNYFQNQIETESGFNPNAHNNASGADGIAQIIVAFHPTMYGKTRDPYISLDYAAQIVANAIAYYGSWSKALIAYNWGPGNLANNWDGTFNDLPGETQHYLMDILPLDVIAHEIGEPIVTDVIRIGPDIPDAIIRQQNDWTCSLRSSYGALWVLAQMGYITAPTYDSWYDIMVPRYADDAVGLKDASGAGLAAALNSLGVTTRRLGNATIDYVRDAIRSGNMVLVGSAAMYHWMLAVGVEADGTLVLENPAGTYKGISNQIRDSWGKFAPWSAVVVEVPQRLPAVGEKGPDVIYSADAPALASALTLVGEAYNYDGTVRKALAAMRVQIEALEVFLEKSATKKQP